LLTVYHWRSSRRHRRATASRPTAGPSKKALLKD